MNFEVVFEKYRNGTATEEEKAYVESEIAKARKLNAVIDELDAKRVVEPAESEDVKKAMRKVNKKNAIRIAVISFIVVAAVALITSLSMFIYVSATASGKSNYTKAMCIEAAKESVREHINDKDSEIVVVDTDKDLYLKYGTFKSAIYIYEIEIRSGYLEYEVMVDSTNGKATIVDIDD